MNLKLIKLQLLIVGFLCAILVTEYMYTTFSEDDIQPIENNHDDNSTDLTALPTLTNTNTQTLDDSELVERPLFYEGRKPIEQSAEDSSETTELSQLDDWQLVGVYNKNKQKMALFSKKDDSKVFLKITTGQLVSGCILQEIHADRVILLQSGQPKIILLRKPRADAPVQAAAPPIRPKGRPIPPRIAKPVMQPPIPNSENANDDNQN